MPVTIKLLATDNTEDNQILKVDSAQRFIINDSDDWQFMFGPNSAPSNSTQIIKIAAQLDTETLDSIRFIGYLYNPVTGAIDSAGGVSFNVYYVTKNISPTWGDNYITSLTGNLQSNSYYFASTTISSLIGTSLDGDTTLMIEAVATRLGRTYRDRIYVNHLGVYSSIIDLRNDVQFLNATKLDE